jgi:hypothetical protein
MWTGVPVVVARCGRRIECCTSRLALDEHQPWRLSILGRELADTIGGPERLMVLWQCHFECCHVLGERRRLGDGDKVRRLPPEHVLSKPCKIVYLRECVLVCILREAGKKTLMVRSDMAVDVGLGREQRGDRHY